METRKEDFKYDADGVSGSAILGSLEGPCADIVNPTRNDRKYSEELWEKVFHNPIVVEQLNAGGIFGELGHPADRQEVDMEKIAICMKKAPTKHNDGLLYGRWDILNTPNGKILKCLCDYGYKIGISSRGSGDIVTDSYGNESVDPDTYEFVCFDAVLVPAVAEARLESVPVKESLNKQGKTFEQSLMESYNSAPEKEKKIMSETLKSLNLHLPQKEGVEIDAKSDTVAAGNGGADVIKNLQEALRENKKLQSTIASLQEKLSVCYAKEAKQEDLKAKCDELSSNLSKSQKVSESLKTRISSLYEKLDAFNATLSEKDTELSSLREHLKSVRKSLSESNSAKDAQIKSLSERLDSAVKASKQKLNESNAKYNKSTLLLQEKLEAEEKHSTELGKQLSSAKSLVEKYKSIAKNAVNKYIETQSIRIGVKPEEIKSRLREGYTFNDIDAVCEELQQYRVSMNNLPFTLGASKRPVGVSVTESIEPIKKDLHIDDEVDEALIELANKK